MFHAEYSSGQPLRMLVDLRSSIMDALARPVSEGKPATATKPRKAAAAAAATGSAATSSQSPEAPVEVAEPAEAPEFEISGDSPEWNPDAASDGSGKENS